MNLKQCRAQLDGWSWNLFSKYRKPLMGCAILGITLSHLDIAQARNGLEVSALANRLHVFTAFVDVFMFLSGLGLYYSQKRNPQSSYANYLKQRAARIIPYYLIISAVTYTIWDIALQQNTVKQVLLEMFFGSWILSGSTKYWFVPAILAFYVLFPVIYKYLHKDDKGIYRLVLFLVCYITAAGVLRNCFAWYGRFQIAIERLPAFVVGAYCGKLSYENVKLPKWMVAGITVLAVGSTVLMYGFDVAAAWIYDTHYAYYFNRMCVGLWMSFTIIFVLENMIRLWPAFGGAVQKVFAYLGGISLEVYLLHQSYMIVFDYPYGAKYVLAAIVLPIATASFIHVIVTKWRRKGGR